MFSTYFTAKAIANSQTHINRLFVSIKQLRKKFYNNSISSKTQIEQKARLTAKHQKQ